MCYNELKQTEFSLLQLRNESIKISDKSRRIQMFDLNQIQPKLSKLKIKYNQIVFKAEQADMYLYLINFFLLLLFFSFFLLFF